MLRAFSVTFKILAMLSLLLAGLMIHGRQRDWEIPPAWAVVLGGIWAAILVRVVLVLRDAFVELPRGGGESGGDLGARGA